MIVDQLEPPSVDLSILYPVIAEPPLSTGVIHDRLICDDEDVVAVSKLGEDEIIPKVVPDAVLEDELVPALLMADI